MRGGSGNDTIYGEDDSDSIYGEAGDDYLSSGQGRDILSGGAGKDTYDFNSVSESPAFGAYDTILDFKWWEGDKIDLTTIDADLGSPGDQAFNRNQLSYSGEVMTANVYGGVDLQIKVVGEEFIPVLDVTA
jgi:Ca2+-binding RTX toxin-like protein